tara:strand:+ start:630 stop:2291 length:1662 start_codon:yes stop_codon:yes gene_type:complete
LGIVQVGLTALTSKADRLSRFLKQELYFKLNGWTLSALLLGFLMFLPIAEVLWHLTEPTENWEHLRKTVLGKYLIGSVILVLGTTLLSVLVGVSCAWLVACCEFPGRKFFEWALVLPLAIPTFVAAYAYFDLMDRLTPLLLWVRLNVSQSAMITLADTLVYPVTIVVLASVLYPYVYLVGKIAFSHQGTRLIEAAQTLGHRPGSVFWRVAFPLARPAIVAGTSLVIMETLNDYGAVLHFGVPTFTTGIFRTWLSMGDLSGALSLAAWLMLLILVLLLIEKVLRSGAKYHDVGRGAGRPFRRYPLENTKAVLAVFCCLLPLIFGFMIPLARIGLWAVLTAEKVLDSSFPKLILNSLGAASLTGFTTVVLALVLAFTARYFKSEAIHASNRLAILGYSIPGSVVAMGILLVSTQLNYAFDWILTGSFVILIFAYVTRFLAVAWHPIDSGMEKSCDQLNDASRALGTSSWRSLLKINMPLLRNTLVAAGLLVFIDTMKELPLTLILRPFNFETLSTKTFDLTSQAQIPESSVPALCIIMVVILPVIWLNRRMEVRT